MTVASQIKQTVASLKGAATTLEKYAIHHPDQKTKELFQHEQAQVAQIIHDLERRIREIEFEEPQFKGF